MGSSHRDSLAAQAAPDLTSADFARVHRITAVDLISEGPIVGLVDGLKSIYLNDDPVDDTPSYLGVTNSVSLNTGNTSDDATLNSLPTVTVTQGSTSATLGAVDSRIKNTVGNAAMLDDGTISISVRFGSDGTITTAQKVVSHQNIYGNDVYVIRLTKTGDPFPAIETLNPFQAGVGGIATNMTLFNPVTGKIAVFGTIRNRNGNSIDFIPLMGSETQIDDIVNASMPVNNDYFLLMTNQWLKVTAGFGTTSLTVATGSTDNIPDGTYNYTVGGGSFNYLEPVTGTSNNETATNHVQLKYEGIQAQFRTGEMFQAPLEKFGSEASGAPTSIGPGQGFVSRPLEFVDSESDTTTNPADPAEYLGTASAGFNLTPAQARGVDEIEITFSYNSLYVVDQTNGDKFDAVAQYYVTLQLIRQGVRTDVQLFNAAKPLVHVHKSTTPITNLLRISLTAFKPFDDFNVIIQRVTRHDGLGLHPETTTNGLGETVNGVKNAGENGKMYAVASISRVMSRIYNPLSYPLSAMGAVTFTSKNFPNTPTRTYECFGRKVKIPSNYTPRTRYGASVSTYTGLWDGTFAAAEEYTDNPAWIFYDILTNNRYGLGEWIEEGDVDIYSLYRVAKYCDELVPDGKGALEPRYRANIYLTKAADAYKVLKDMATTFLGLLYWMNGKVTVIADQQKDSLYLFNKTNVIGGEFSYEGTGAKTRANQIVVSWNNPRSNYRLEPLIVEDSQNIADTGKIISEEAMAFGCISEGQATRYGRWKLLTSRNQTELVKFSTSIDAGFLAPGDVITIQDNNRFATTHGGRVGRFKPLDGISTTNFSQLEPSINTSFPITGGASGGFFQPTIRENNVVIQISVIFPHRATISGFAKCLLEQGGTDSGLWTGVKPIGGKWYFEMRVGNGTGSTGTDFGKVVANVPVDDVPEFDGLEHEVTWELLPDDGKASLWIDGRLVFQEYTANKSAFDSNGVTDSGIWAGSGDGGVLMGTAPIAGNNTANAWGPLGSRKSPLKRWGLATTPANRIYLDRSILIKSTSDYSITVLLEKEEDTTTEGEDRPMQTITKQIDTTWQNNVAGTEVDYLQVDSDFEYHPGTGSIWVVTETDSDEDSIIEGSAKEYKIMTITEADKGSFTIVASEYIDDKFDRIESEEGFTLVRDETLYPTIDPLRNVPPVEQLRVSVLPNFTSAKMEATIAWTAPLVDDNGTDVPYPYTTFYEVTHDIPGVINPMKVGPDETQVILETVPPGSYNVKVQVVNQNANRSMPRTTVLNIDPTNIVGNIERSFAGLPVGGKTTLPITLDVDDIEAPDDIDIYTAGNPLEVIHGPITSLDTSDSDIPIGVTNVMLDADESKFRAVKTAHERGRSYWYDAIDSGNLLQAGNWTQLAGTGAQGEDDTLIVGTNTSWTTDLKVGDLIRWNSAFGFYIAEVVIIHSDTLIRVDMSPKGTGQVGLPITAGTLYRNTLRVDPLRDTIVGQIIKNAPAGANGATEHDINWRRETYWNVIVQQPIDLRVEVEFDTTDVLITGFTGTAGQVEQCMLNELKLGLVYGPVNQRGFGSFPGYPTEVTYTGTTGNPVGNQFKLVPQSYQGAGGLKWRCDIEPGYGEVDANGIIKLSQDVHLPAGYYYFKFTVEQSRDYSVEEFVSQVSGIPQHASLNDSGIKSDFALHKLRHTTFGTSNVSPLYEFAYSNLPGQMWITTGHGTRFSTKMITDRNETDILQPTDELVYHWQFNDIAGNYITEGIEGKDGEAES